MDMKTEGYLVAAIGLIPAGIALVTEPELAVRLMGMGMIALGLAAVYLRGKEKDVKGT